MKMKGVLWSRLHERQLWGRWALLNIIVPAKCNSFHSSAFDAITAWYQVNLSCKGFIDSCVARETHLLNVGLILDARETLFAAFTSFSILFASPNFVWLLIPIRKRSRRRSGTYRPRTNAVCHYLRELLHPLLAKARASNRSCERRSLRVKPNLLSPFSIYLFAVQRAWVMLIGRVSSLSALRPDDAANANSVYRAASATAPGLFFLLVRICKFLKCCKRVRRQTILRSGSLQNLLNWAFIVRRRTGLLLKWWILSAAEWMHSHIKRTLIRARSQAWWSLAKWESPPAGTIVLNLGIFVKRSILLDNISSIKHSMTVIMSTVISTKTLNH